MAAPRSLAVVSRRSEPPDSLDYFPTPPWATRALIEHVLEGAVDRNMSVLEPACGEGHMAAVLMEYFDLVHAADVFDYGYGNVRDYLTDGSGLSRRPDWIITNPPFNKAEAFLDIALNEATKGVALLLRTVWMHGVGRHNAVFVPQAPTLIAPYAERVPMVKGEWNPDASTATDYCWFVWDKDERYRDFPPQTSMCWIPPGCRKSLTRRDDLARFAAKAPAPLLDGGAA